MEIATPRPAASIGCGSKSRGSAVAPMITAATTIIAPSTPAAKYSAFWCPYACSSSAGLSAQRIARIATTAATRLTTDSAASESRPTESVSSHAVVLSVIVATAAAIASHSSLYRRPWSIADQSKWLHLRGNDEAVATSGCGVRNSEVRSQRRSDQGPMESATA